MFEDNCSKCAALCCVALAFDKSHLFGCDKAAGTACTHLDGKAQCGIHDDKKQQGFLGCVLYSCQGAGQRVTQECFGGQSWQDHPQQLPAMLKAFQSARKVHELLSLLSESQKLPLNSTQHQQAKNLIADLTPNPKMPNPKMSVRWLAALPYDRLEADVSQFLKTLQPLVKKRR